MLLRLLGLSLLLWLPNVGELSVVGGEEVAAAEQRGAAQDRGARPARQPVRSEGPAGGRQGGAAEDAEATEASAPRPGTRIVTPLVQDAADEEQILAWFQTCDFNENGWISFREARASLKFDRARYAVYDIDRDGRLSPEEFETNYRYSIQHGGFQPPAGKEGPKKPPQRTPEQIRNAYDTDLDEHLSLLELSRLLQDYERLDVTADQVLRSLDSDLDEKLVLSELAGLAGILHPVTLTDEVELTAKPEPPPRTVLELFGKMEPRGTSLNPQPPLIVGPVSHFRRLDVNDDGQISTSDLEELLLRNPTKVRPRTVLNTLDSDGDGMLSESEFLKALVHRDD